MDYEIPTLVVKPRTEYGAHVSAIMETSKQSITEDKETLSWRSGSYGGDFKFNEDSCSIGLSFFSRCVLGQV